MNAETDSLKKHLYGIAADAGEANAERYHKTSDEQKATQTEVKKHAMEDEAARDEKLAEGRVHDHRHHRLAVAATLAEIGIAICTVAIITRRRSFRLGSLMLSLARRCCRACICLPHLTDGSVWRLRKSAKACACQGFRSY